MIKFLLLSLIFTKYVFTQSINRPLKINFTTAEYTIDGYKGVLGVKSLSYYNTGSQILLEPNTTEATGTLTELHPNTKYAFAVSFPDGNFDSVYFTTKPVTVQFDIQAHPTTAVITFNFEAGITSTACNLVIYFDGGKETLLRGEEENSNCKNIEIFFLTPETNYTIEYFNKYMAAPQNRSFTTEKRVFRVHMHSGFTTAEVVLDTNLTAFSNCDATVVDIQNTLLPFSCNLTPGCRECRNFTITGLKAATTYILKYHFNGNQQNEDIAFQTRQTRFYLNSERQSVSEYFIDVVSFDGIEAPKTCNIIIDKGDAICEAPCPTNCKPFKIILQKIEYTSIIMTTDASPNNFTIDIQPMPYNISLTKQFLRGHVIHMEFQANTKGGGVCEMAILQDITELKFKCTNGKCSNDCDNLIFDVEDIAINIQIKVRITNKFLPQPQFYTINLRSLISFNETFVTTQTTAAVEVLNGGVGTCDALLKYASTFVEVIPDCNNNDKRCTSCLSYKYTGLIPNTEYIIDYTLPDQTKITKKFRTKPQNIKVDVIKSSTYIQFAISSDYNVDNTKCSIILELLGSFHQSCNGSCTSCLKANYYQLLSGSSYLFTYNTPYLRTPYSEIVTTNQGLSNGSAFAEGQYTSLKVNIFFNSSVIEVCDVDVFDPNYNKVPFNCTELIECRNCKSFQVDNVLPKRTYAVVISFLNSADQYSLYVDSNSLHIHQFYTQTEADTIEVSVEALGISNVQSVCTVSLSKTSVVCENCPKNCTDYKLKISSAETFVATVSSPYLVTPHNLIIRPIKFLIELDYATYDGKNLLVNLIPNLLKAGECTLLVQDSGKNLPVRCNNGTCVLDCDKLKVNISEIIMLTQVTLVVQNKHLRNEVKIPVTLTRKIMLGKIIETTSVSADIEIIGGNTCCCSLIIQHDFREIDVCRNNEDCSNCRSFTITGLIPATSYTVKLTLPDKSTQTSRFNTTNLQLSLHTVTSFTNFVVHVNSPYNLTQTKCSFTVFDDINNDIVTQCSSDCASCETFTAKNLVSDTTYHLEYNNSLATHLESVTITTLKFVSQFPQVIDALQVDAEHVKIVIFDETTYKYRGTLEVFAFKNDSVEFDKTHVIPIIKRYFDNNAKDVLFKIRPGFLSYEIVTCIYILQSQCINEGSEFSCLECDERREQVCPKETLYGEISVAKFSDDYTSFQVAHSSVSLNCHREYQCYIALVSIFRKNVNLTKLNTQPNELFYYEKGIGVNYIAILDQAQCNQTSGILVQSSKTASNKPLITANGVYYTISFIICNSLACFQSQEHQFNFFVDKGANARGIGLTAAGFIIAIVLYAAAVYMFLKYPVQKKKIVKRETDSRKNSILKPLNAEAQTGTTSEQ